MSAPYRHYHRRVPDRSSEYRPIIDTISMERRQFIDIVSAYRPHIDAMSIHRRYHVDIMSIFDPVCRYVVDIPSVYQPNTDQISTICRHYVDTPSIRCRYYVDIRPRMSTSLCCMESALQMSVLERCLPEEAKARIQAGKPLRVQHVIVDVGLRASGTVRK